MTGRTAVSVVMPSSLGAGVAGTHPAGWPIDGRARPTAWSSSRRRCSRAAEAVSSLGSPSGDGDCRTVVLLWCAGCPSTGGVVASDQRRDRLDGSTGSAAARTPPRADRVLLPHARLVLRRRRRRAGDHGPGLAWPGRLRGPFGPEVVAVPDRDK